jgi:hypothetical protein
MGVGLYLETWYRALSMHAVLQRCMDPELPVERVAAAATSANSIHGERVKCGGFVYSIWAMSRYLHGGVPATHVGWMMIQCAGFATKRPSALLLRIPARLARARSR